MVLMLATVMDDSGVVRLVSHLSYEIFPVEGLPGQSRTVA